MTHRIHNFCAGPCTLPLTVLEEARAELTDFQGCGMSVMEISHRSARFEALHHETLALASRLIGAPDDFQALLLPGGAHQQFDMIPLTPLGARQVELRLGADVRGGFLRDLPEFRHGFAGRDLDFEHGLKLMLQRPDIAHFRIRIAFYHGCDSSCHRKRAEPSQHADSPCLS